MRLLYYQDSHWIISSKSRFKGYNYVLTDRNFHTSFYESSWEWRSYTYPTSILIFWTSGSLYFNYTRICIVSQVISAFQENLFLVI